MMTFRDHGTDRQSSGPRWVFSHLACSSCARLVAVGLLGLLLCWTLSAGVKAADDEPEKGSAAKPAAKAIPAEAKEAFDAAGLKVVGGNLTLPGENELGKMFADVAKQKKALIGAERDLRSVEAEVDEIKEQVNARKIRRVELNAQLTQVQPGDTLGNNRIVGELNALGGQIDLGLQQQDAAAKRLKAAIIKAREVRESYVELTLNMRKLADGTTEKWTQLAADPALQEAVASASAATGKKLKLAPSPSFVAAEKKLLALEHTVLSETIPMSTEDNGLSVTVVIDGKHKCQMAVDSGASGISLPFAMAKDFGLEPKSSDQQITVSLADGREVPATLIKIGTVRVGKFTVEDVECYVLDAKAVKAPALLGMSFLGNFTFEIDKQKAELRMVKVDSGDSGGKSKPASAKSKPGKSKQGKSKSKDDMDQ